MVEKEDNDLVKRIKNLQRKVNRIDREMKVGTEDQLFFGVVVSVTVFLITLSLSDIAAFIQSATSVDYSVALTLSTNLKNAAFSLLVLSATLRYYAALKPHKGARLFSFLTLLSALDIFLLLFFPMLSFNIGSEAKVIVFILSYALLTAIFIVQGRFFESKVILFLADRGCVHKKYAKPIVSFLFACASGGVYIYVTVLFLMQVVFQVRVGQIQNLVLFFVCYVLFAVTGYILFLRRQKILSF